MRELGPNRDREAFVGRGQEFAELVTGIDGALASEGRLLMISGEPGVGKSRLARQAVIYAEQKGARALWGRCWEHGGAPPYWPWVQALRRLIADAEPTTLSGWLGTDAADIAQIAPEVRERLGDLPEPPSAALALPDCMSKAPDDDSVPVWIVPPASVTPPFCVCVVPPRSSVPPVFTAVEPAAAPSVPAPDSDSMPALTAVPPL